MLTNIVEIVSHCLGDYRQVLLEFEVQQVFRRIGPKYSPVLRLEPDFWQLLVASLSEFESTLSVPAHSPAGVSVL